MGLVPLKVRRSTGLPAFDNRLRKQCILKTIRAAETEKTFHKIWNGLDQGHNKVLCKDVSH